MSGLILDGAARLLRQLGSGLGGNGADAVAGAVKYVATMAALIALRVPVGTDAVAVIVRGRDDQADGGGDAFVWLAGDQSANVSVDPTNFVAPSADPTGAGGAWMRARRRAAARRGLLDVTATAESSSVGADWNYTKLDGLGFVSSNTAKQHGWLAAADGVSNVTVETPFGVIIGDSIAEGHPALHGRLHPNANTYDPAWVNSPGQLSYELARKTGYYWYNHGIGGQTSAQVWARWRRDVLAENFDPGDGRGASTLPRKPAVVWVNAGINDISGGVALLVTKANLLRMAVSAAAANITIGFNTAGPNNTHNAGQIAQQKALGAWMKETLPLFGAYVFDFRAWAEGPADTVNAQLFADSVHPSRAGYISLASHMVADTAAPIVMNALVVESKYDPAAMPSQWVESLGLQVSDGTNVAGARFTSGEARLPPSWDATNTKALTLKITDVAGGLTGAKWAGISRVYGVFGVGSSANQQQDPFTYVMATVSGGVWNLAGIADRRNVIDVGIDGATRLRVRFNRPVKFATVCPLGTAATYRYNVHMLAGSLDRAYVYIIDAATNTVVDPAIVTGGAGFSLLAING